MTRLFVTGNDDTYARFIANHEIVDDIDDADVVLFTGGEDVNPKMYGCERHPSTYSSISRDLREQKVFKSVKPGKLCVGICRGLICGSR